MTTFIQTLGGVLIAAILCTILSRQQKDMVLLLTLAACCMVIITAGAYLKPVVDLLKALKDTANMDVELFEAVLKAVGIGLIAEIVGLICVDSGNAGLGKVVEVLSAAVILWLSIPLMNALLSLVQQMVGSV